MGKKKKLYHGEDLQLYLVDEVTLKPVLRVGNPVFPIKITTQFQVIAAVDESWFQCGIFDRPHISN